MPTKRASLVANTVTEYLNLVFGLTKASSAVRCYRGQADASWSYQPSVLRDLKPGAENRMFSELMVEAPNEFVGERLMFNKLVKAQHYGLPTRLLDVSLNPLVGLYFSCWDEKHKSSDGLVRVFDFLDRRMKFADSDAVSLICNLARLSDSERAKIVEAFSAVKTETKTGKTKFRNIPAMKRLSQFVRMEKPYFLDIADPRDLFKYYFVYPSKNNPRLIAQSGAFVVAGLLKYKSPEKSEGLEVTEIRIPASRKSEYLEQLDALNINSRALFPEIESASKYIKKRWSTA